MLAYVRTSTGANCNGILQLEATFIDVKKRWVQIYTNIPYTGTSLPWCFSDIKYD